MALTSGAGSRTRRGRGRRSFEARADIHLSAKQANIFVWGWQPEARFRDAVCGRRFGKTFLGVREILRAARLASEWGVSADDEIWYAAPTFRQAKRVFWRRLKQALPGTWLAGKPNESECVIHLLSGHVIRLVGLDAFDNLRGSGLFFVLVDEWADCPPAAWVEVLRPMLSTCRYVRDGVEQRGGHALRMGTPKGFNHCYESFVAGQPGGEPDHKSWIYSSLQGGQVPAEEIARARAVMDARSFRQEYEAGFEQFAGRVYYAFERAHSLRACAFDARLPVLVGVDFNINPMSAVVCQQHGDALWLVDEIVLPTSNTGELAREIVRRFGRAGFDPLKPELAHISVFPDPAGAQRRTSAAGQTDIGILQAAGLSVLALEAHPRVRERVNLTNAWFCNAEGRRLLFVDPRCVKTIECLEKLCYREGSGEPDKSGGFDHLPDALGYLLCTRAALAGKAVVGRFEMGR